MDTLVRSGPTETKALKISSGAQSGRRAEFDRAIKELQEKFLAFKFEERYDPFTYVWDTVEHRWADAIREARALSPSAATDRLVRRYFAVAGFGHERAVARKLGLRLDLVEAAARRLEREGLILRNQRVAGIRETISHLTISE